MDFLSKNSLIAFFVFLFVFSCGKPGSSSGTSSDHPSKDTLQQCALDLCGLPKVSLHSYSDVEQMVQTDLKKKWGDEFRALGGREIVEKWVENQMGPFDSLQRDFQKSDMFREFGFDYLQPEDYEKLSNTFFNPYIRWNIDYSQPPSSRLLYMRIEWPREVSKQLKEGAESYIRDLKQKIGSSFTDALLLDLMRSPSIYTRMEAYNILIEEWEDFIEKYKRERELNDTFGDSEDIAERMNEMEKRMRKVREGREKMTKGKDIGGFLLREGAAALESLEESFIAEKTGSWPEKKLLCREKACREAIEEIITELFIQYETPLPRKDKEDYQWAQCLSKFIVIKQMEKGLPNGLNISYLKRNFLEKVLKDFSSSTKESFENYINNDFYIGLSRNFNLPDFLEYINMFFFDENKARPMKKEPKGFSGKVSSIVNEIDNAELITDMYRNREIPLAFESESSFEDDLLCKSDTNPDRLVHPTVMSFAFGGVPSSANSSKPASILSPVSFLHPYYGRGRASHEMGHLLSWMFAANQLSGESYSSYKKLRECSSKRYKHLNALSNFPDPFEHRHDQWNTEEDTADLISYLTVLDRKNTYYTCVLIPITEDETEYKDLSILDYNSESKHSTPLLRVIFEAIHKRAALSPACQQIVDQYKDDIDFNPCF